MIGEHDNRVWVPFKIMTPLCERTDDSEQFSVEDLVISFSRVQGLGQVTAWMILSIIIGLKKYRSSSHERGVSCNCELTSRIRITKYRLTEETIFQSQERFVTRVSPQELGVFLCEIYQRTCEVRVVRDKVPIEVAEPQKGPRFLYCGGDGPIPNSVEFSGVHSDVAGFDDHAKIFHFFGVECALFGFQK
jgi:hypothetical protein